MPSKAVWVPANKTVTEKVLRNVGPSITYKLRDAAGQAVEYHNYMLPVELDGAACSCWACARRRRSRFRYLRIPADENDSMDGFLRLRAALDNPVMRAEAVRRYSVKRWKEGGLSWPKRWPRLPPVPWTCLPAPSGSIYLMASATVWARPGWWGGCRRCLAFLEANVPPEERERASDVLVRILNGTLFELMQLSREARWPVSDAA
jgi:cytochrome c biogenesis protein